MINREQSFTVLYPNLLKYWDSERNSKLSPFDYSPNSRLVVHWVCSQGHSFRCSIRAAVRKFACVVCNSLGVKFPELAKQWHPSKNGKLRPIEVSQKSDKLVWWKCTNGHEWKAKVNNRSNGNGCPYCAGQKASKSYNLAKLFPKLAREWNSEKNGSKKTCQYTPGSKARVWWKCLKNPNHEWCVRINARTSGNGCPFCKGQYADEENNFAVLYPEIAKEWDYKKNGENVPENFRPGSDFKAAWKCNAKGHTWTAKIDKRVRVKQGCPVCSHKKLHHDNCLSSLFPDIAKQFHPDKNGGKTAKDYIAGTGKKMWWKCEKGHEWYASISSRTFNGSGCPSCRPNVSRLELRVFAELSFYFPDAELSASVCDFEVDVFIPNSSLGIEIDGFKWHRDKTKFDENKGKQLQKEGITLIRLREKPLLPLAKDDVLFDKKNSQIEIITYLFQKFLSMNNFNSREKSFLREWLTRESFINESSYTELLSTMMIPKEGQSFAEKCPDLVDEWDYDKNNGLRPEHFYAMSDIKVHWKCLKKGHSWKTQIKARAKGSECPYCRGRFACEDNCLATLYPDLSAQWDMNKNGSLNPNDVTTGSGKRVWWKCENNHSWQAAIYSRVKGNGCAMCSNKGNRKNYIGTQLRP